LQEAIQINASDIHFEPGIDGLRVRYRVDGVLRIGTTKPLKNAAAISSRLKIMARLDIAERRMPQDGRIQLKISGKELDIRISTIPTMFGENIVIRILDKSNVVLDFDHLGFDEETLQQFKTVLSTPDGIFLVTGPTGCGKTTTLYTALNQINSIERKLVTVEDPVEYQLEGVNQIAVQPKIGLTFDKVLRSILRQDPDVIMVGEMRDTETARIAVQAALTGHLVLSTLHTNDAVTGITRLLDMGVEDYLVASTLNGVLAQRLLRRLCNHCKTKISETSNEYAPSGCDECGHTGYKGRIAITEFLIINDEFRDLIVSRASRSALKQEAKKAGMRTLYESGLNLVEKGITSRVEVLKVASEV
jgi:general secretion pathway protein E